MLAMAIQILWFLVYLLCFCGAVALVLYGINTFIWTIPPRIVNAVWFIVLLLAIIYALTLLAGGGGVVSPFHR
jgi:hypothetical protein